LNFVGKNEKEEAEKGRKTNGSARRW